MSTNQIVEILGKAFQLAHQDSCYPTSSEGERQIAAERMIEALEKAGFKIIETKAD